MSTDTDKTMKSIEQFFSILGKVLTKTEMKSFESIDITRLATCPRGITNQDGGVPGGLVSFSLEVALKGKSLAEFYSVDPKQIVKVALLHELGKMGHVTDEKKSLYLQQDSTWHQEKLGQYYKYNDNCAKMNVGHRTLFMLNELGIKLEYDEWIALATSQGLHLQENAFYGNGQLPRLALLLQAARNVVLSA